MGSAADTQVLWAVVVMSHMTEHVGRVVGGRYRLLAPLGSGASAEVYLADDVRLRRRVAVKILHSALAEDEAFLRRFRAEARAAAALSHPNILAIFDWNGDEVPPYIVTEFLSGGSLRSMLDAGNPLTPSQALLVGLSAAQALDRAHKQGFVHRDIKPANLLFGGDARLRVADFGLARAIAEAGWTEPTGAVLGTARYSSPEQARGEPLDGKSDVYSLALVLVEAVTGLVPFTLDTTIGTLMARLDRPLEVPEELDALAPVVALAGQLDPAQRPDAATLAQELIDAANDLPRPEPLVLVGASTAAAANGAGPAVEDERDRTVLHGAIDPADTTAPQPLPAPQGPPPPIVPGVPVAPGAPAPAAPGSGHSGPAHMQGHPSGPLPPPPRLAPTARADRARKVLIGVVAAVAAVALGVAVTLVVTQQLRPTHVVPEALIGIPKAEVTEHVGDFGWKISYEEIDHDQPAGTVLDTRPKVGSKLREGERLTVVVSKGPPLVTVPSSDDLRGLTREQATEVLGGSGIGLVPEFVDTPHEEIEKDHVIGFAADTPAELPAGATVEVEVSSGPSGPEIADVTGWEAEEAAEELEDDGFQVDFRGEANDEQDSGNVLRSEPAAGERAAEGSTVVLVVAQGDNVEVPDIVGKRLRRVRDMLESRGLSVGSISGSDSDDSMVIGSFPWPGTQVPQGSTVDLTVF